jgi:hypothetical protein
MNAAPVLNNIDTSKQKNTEVNLFSQILRKMSIHLGNLTLCGSWAG